MKTIRYPFLGLVPMVWLSACATLPHSGPSAAVLRKAGAADFSVVRVSPKLAQRMADAQRNRQKREMDSALHTLEDWGARSPGLRSIVAGSRIALDLWTQSVHIFGSGDKGESLTSVPLGTYRVNGSGEIALPYLGPVRLQGDTLAQADRLLSKKYRALGRFAAPEVRIRWAKKGYPKGVILSGDVRKPGFVPWVPGGLPLPKVLAQGGLPGSLAKAGKSQSQNHYPVVVTIVYRGKSVRLPLDAIWKHRLYAVPGERIVVQRPAIERVTVLGGGVAHPGNYRFGRDVNVNQVLAESGGLLSSTANDREIFVLQKREKNRARLYVLRWDDAQGLLAAERFPMQNGEMLYVPTAPVVPLEKAVQIFSGFVMPPALLANAVK